MAITAGDCMVWRTLRRAGLIPDRPLVLELGKANWYGDVRSEELERDRLEFAPDGALTVEECGFGKFDMWSQANWYYEMMLRNPQRLAIDLDPNAAGARPFDLNHVCWIGEHPDATFSMVKLFDIVINTGTLEHVFSQHRAWSNAHDNCKPGGLMVHSVPLWGWFDHGFYNYHPTFVVDVAVENGYDVLAWFYADYDPHNRTTFVKSVTGPADIRALQHRGGNAMMHFAYRKTAADAFRIPMQGVYSSRATADDVLVWLSRQLVN